MEDKKYDEWGGETYSFLNNRTFDDGDFVSSEDRLEQSLYDHEAGFDDTAYEGLSTPEAEDIVNAVNDKCAVLNVALDVAEDEDAMYVEDPNVFAEALDDGIFRLTIDDAEAPAIAYKLDRWKFMQSEEEEQPLIFLILFPEKYADKYGLCCASPFDWYFRSETPDGESRTLQILFVSDFVRIGGFMNEGAEGGTGEEE